MTDRIKIIIDAVAAAHRIPPTLLQVRTQQWDVARPRQIAMCLARKLTPMSLTAIAKRMGMHHTSVLWAVRRVAYLRQIEPEFDELYVRCEARARGEFAAKAPHLRIPEASTHEADEADAARVVAKAQKMRDLRRAGAKANREMAA